MTEKETRKELAALGCQRNRVAEWFCRVFKRVDRDYQRTRRAAGRESDRALAAIERRIAVLRKLKPD